MNRTEILVLIAILIMVPCKAFAANSETGGIQTTFTERLYQDFINFYSAENFESLAFGVGAAGILANTELDEDIQDLYRETVKSGSLFLKQPNNLGKVLLFYPYI